MALSLAWGTSARANVLEVHPANPRWLTDDGGKTALVLTGAHTWSLFQDYRFDRLFDAEAYLAGLAEHGHNFTRGWHWEDGYYAPLPWAEERGSYRLSPPFNEAYVRRLRGRIRAARGQGLYVSVMLFEGWSVDDHGGLREPAPWPEHPYNRRNTGETVARQKQRLHVGAPLRQQLDYVSFLAGELCAEPNILWEVANETTPQSFGAKKTASWQRAILAHLARECPGRLRWVSCPEQIETPMEARQTFLATLSRLPADIVSPCDRRGVYTQDPPAADGRRVVVADSDHFDQRGVGFEWAWKAFLRGQHPVFLDLATELTWWNGERWNPREARWQQVRGALGAIQELVVGVNRRRAGGPQSGLADMVPQSSANGGPNDHRRPASSSWALFSTDHPCRRKGANGRCHPATANGDELLVYADASEAVTICSLAAGDDYRVRWKRATGPGYLGPAVTRTAGSKGCVRVRNPDRIAAVVHVERE